MEGQATLEAGAGLAGADEIVRRLRAGGVGAGYEARPPRLAGGRRARGGGRRGPAPGAGGMGAVYEARHLRLAGRRVAVKVLLRDLARDAEVFARFRREAEIGARLGHPNIISVVDWNELPDGAPFLVMELLDGEDLAAR